MVIAYVCLLMTDIMGFLLDGYSVPSPTRKEGESAIYRNARIGHDKPLMKTHPDYPEATSVFGTAHISRFEVLSFCGCYDGRGIHVGCEIKWKASVFGNAYQ